MNPLPDSPLGRASGAASLGALLGLVLLALLGPPTGPDEERRVVVTPEALELPEGASPSEVRGAVAEHLRAELLFREGRARSYLEAEPEASRASIVRTMEAIGTSRASLSLPDEEEIEAYYTLRRDRYRDVDPGETTARSRVVADLQREAREAAREQFFQEVAQGFRIVLAPELRSAVEGAGFEVAAPGEAGAEEEERDDLAFLLLRETAPGEYEAVFTTPLPPAGEPVPAVHLPEACPAEAEPEELETGGSRTTLVRIACPAGSILGERLRPEGLEAGGLGLHLELQTLEGRRYSRLLPPSSGELGEIALPAPPAPGEAVARAGGAGLAAALGSPALWLLLTALVLAGFGVREVGLAAAALAGGHLLGHWLWLRGALLTPAHLAPAAALLLVLVPALALALGRPPPLGRLRPLWLALGLLGALFAAAWPVPGARTWLTTGEELAALLLFGGGLLLGMSLIVAAARVLGAGLPRRGPAVEDGRAEEARGTALLPLLGMLLVGGATALLLPRLAALGLLLPTGLPPTPLELALLGLLLGFALPALGLRIGAGGVWFLALLLAAGAGGGLGSPDHLLWRGLLLGGLFLLAAFLVPARKPAARLLLPAMGVLVVAYGWHLRQMIEAGGALHLGPAVGSALVALCLFHAALRTSEGLSPERRLRLGRGAGVGAAAVLVLLRLGEYREWVEAEVAAQLALGRIPLPLLALALLALGLLALPRRRKVPEALGVAPPPRRTGLVLLALAFFLLPVGTVGLPNPVFQPAAPGEDDVRLVLSELLSNTYHAFNLDDEEELYDRLSESVTDELLPILYLDSRRRLAAGTAEEDEITVRDVRLLDMSGAVAGTSPESGFTYRGQWVVTASIRHLQHTHHRQNVYNGSLVLRLDGGRWKIANVELTAEERVVVPWSPT